MLIRIDQGESIPERVADFSGICLLGGPMSVNDDLPWIAPLLRWIQQADQSAIPVIGHCLGGQLLSKALGASVQRNPVKEIGWGILHAASHSIAQRWLTDAMGVFHDHWQTFQWHGETFDLPDQAVALFSSRHCANQGYVIERQNLLGQRIAHLALQCHIEMTVPLVHTWVAAGVDEIAEDVAMTGGRGVQMPEEILQELSPRIAALNAMAEMLYAHWLSGCNTNNNTRDSRCQ